MGKKNGVRNRKKINLEPIVVVEQESKISCYKKEKQFLLRIPKRIVEVMGIKKGDKIIFKVENPKSKKDKKLIMDYEVSK